MADNNTLTLAEQNAALMAEIAALKAAANQPRAIGLKVSDKGAVSVYGLGRFPTTLYRSQWERLLAPETVARINAFIVANEAALKVKE